MEEQKKRGNPSFGRKYTVETQPAASAVEVMDDADFEARLAAATHVEKPEEPEIDLLTKVYNFELIKTYDRYKPERIVLGGSGQEFSSGKDHDNVFPPKYILPNKGVAYDEVTKRQRAWRFINSEKSIWIDEQRVIDDPKEEQFILGELENELAFVRGKLDVRAIEESKVQALLIQDSFEGKKVKLKQGARPIYRLLDPEQQLASTNSSLDTAYEAETKARTASVAEMKAFGAVLGLNTDLNDKELRTQFILKAKVMPAFFLKNFGSERNKIFYTFKQALKNNRINANQKQRLVWGETGELIFAHDNTGDVVDKLTNLVIQHDDKATRLYEKLK